MKAMEKHLTDKMKRNAQLWVLRKVVPNLKKKAATILIREYLAKSDATVLAAAIDAVGKAGLRDLLLALRPFLSAQDPDIASRAMRSALTMGSTAGYALVASLLNHKNPRIRVTATLAMWRKEPEKALQTLKDLSDSKIPRLRAVVLPCVAHLRDPRGEALLLQMMAKEDDRTLFEAQTRCYAMVATRGTLKTFLKLKASLPLAGKSTGRPQEGSLANAWKAKILDRALVSISERLGFARGVAQDYESGLRRRIKDRAERLLRTTQRLKCIESLKVPVRPSVARRRSPGWKLIVSACCILLTTGILFGGNKGVASLPTGGSKPTTTAAERLARSSSQAGRIKIRGSVFRVQEDSRNVIVVTPQGRVVSAALDRASCQRLTKGDEVRLTGVVLRSGQDKVLYLRDTRIVRLC